MVTKSRSLSANVAAVGLVLDRTSLQSETPICSAFMVADRLVATVASNIVPYINNPRALKVSFPTCQQTFGVSSLHVHPKFNLESSSQSTVRGTTTNCAEAAVFRFNCCLLRLNDEFEFVPESEIEAVSAALRFPLELNDNLFRGSLKDIELPAVIQTLNHGRKQGTLYICDELTRPIAQVFCSEGRIVSAKFHNLLNDLALYQIVEKRLSGKFAFLPCKGPSWLPRQTIVQQSESVLIEAHRRLDELNKLKTSFADDTACFARAGKDCHLDQIPVEQRKLAEMLWWALDATTPANEFWQIVGVDDYSIFRALQQLFNAQQIVKIQEGGTRQLDLPAPEAAPRVQDIQPLPLGYQISLSPFDQLISTNVNSFDGKYQVRSGALLGAIDAYDSWHLLHDIPLLPVASGSPIFKGDLVIGMHCGALTSAAVVENSAVILQQLLWVEAIKDLRSEVARIVTKAGTRQIELPPEEPAPPSSIDALPGCHEVAPIACANCGRKTFQNARKCMRCGFEFVPQLEQSSSSPDMSRMLGVAVAVVVLCVATAVYGLQGLPHPIYQNNIYILPRTPWVTGWLSLLKGEQWDKMPANADFANGDELRINIESNRDNIYLYALYAGESDKGYGAAASIYPNADLPNISLSKGKVVTIPDAVSKVAGGQILTGLQVSGSPGTDKILILASQHPLLHLDEKSSNQIFSSAYQILAGFPVGAGILVTEEALTGLKLPAAAEQPDIFATEINVVHHDKTQPKAKPPEKSAVDPTKADPESLKKAAGETDTPRANR